MKFWRKIGYSIMISAAVLSWTALPTWAGEWQQLEDGSWKYEEDGAYVTGWKQIDGIWYYMDPETELWDAAPALNETSACYLLENAVNKAGWYRNEESHMVYKVDSSDPYTITVSIMLEKEPDRELLPRQAVRAEAVFRKSGPILREDTDGSRE